MAASGYDAFISYSHALDDKLAPRFQTMVERFAKPWYRTRALRVFRDTASLSANPDLWASIEVGLAASRWLVLLASPAAARSVYVQRETAWWLAHKPAEHMLVVLTSGELTLADDDAPATAALPPTLEPAMDHEPRWVDLRWLRDSEHVSEANPRLRECVADVASAVRGVPKDLLVGDHIRFHRRAIRLARTAGVALALLTVAAVAAALVAVGQRNEAQAQRDNALFNQILTQGDRLASVDVSLSAELSVLAYRMKPTPDAYSALVARGNQTRSLPLIGHTEKIRAVAYDPRAIWIASGSEDHTVRIYRPDDATSTVVDLGGQAIVNSLTSSPDGRILVAGLIDGTLRRWDLTDPHAPLPLGDPLPTSSQPVVAVAYSPDGRTVAAGAADNRLRFWDVTDPTHPRLSDTTVPGFRGVAFRQDGRVLAAGDSSNDSVGLWDMTNPLHPAPLGSAVIGHQDQVVNTVAFSPDGRSLISGGTDRYAQVWDVTDPRRPAVIGTSVAAGNSVNTVAVAPDASATVAIGSVDQRIQLMNLANPQKPTYLDGDGVPGAPDGYIMALAYSPDAHHLVVGYSNGALRLWDVPGHYGGSTDWLETVQFSPDGQTIAAAGQDSRIRIWRRDDPAQPTVLSGHTSTIWRLAFSPDGHTLASASEDGTARLWDVTTPQAPPRIVETDSSPIKNVAFSPDGRTLAVVGQAVRLWNVPDLDKPPRTLNPGPEQALAVTFSPDGHRLAAGYADAAIDLWDLTRPFQPAQILRGHTEAIVDMAISPDGQYLASTGVDQTVRLWHIGDTGDSTPPVSVLTGHTDTVNAAVFSPDGHRLATGGDDRTVRLWNLDNPALPTSLGEPLPLGPTSFGAESYVTGLSYSPDGRSLAITSTDGTVRAWDLDADTLVRRICTTATHNLTAATWEKYFRDQTFPVPPCG